MMKLFFLLMILLLNSLLPVSGSPENRIGPRMVYDPVNARVILYGGAHWDNDYTIYGELWSYQLESNTWTKLETINNPEPRFNSMIAYIPGRHQLFLFGGFTTNDRIADTWIYDFESSIWTELQPRNQPSPRSDSCMAYDPENDVVVLYSGYLLDDSNTQDTWIYSFEEENWILKNSDNPPLGQYGHYMVYADSLGQLLMYPGHWSIYSNSVMVSHGFGGNIWEYDVVEDMWTERFSDSIPPGRYWGNLVYDSTENRLILFGGHGATDYDDTWVYNLEEKTWDKAIQNIKPSKRGSIGMAYDPINHAVVLFGGYNENGQSLGDTWILDCETLTWYQPENTSNTVPEDDTSSFSIPGFPLLASFLAITLISLLKKTSLIE